MQLQVAVVGGWFGSRRAGMEEMDGEGTVQFFGGDRLGRDKTYLRFLLLGLITQFLQLPFHPFSAPLCAHER